MSVVTKSSPGKSKRLIYIPQGVSCGSVGSRTWGRTETSEGSKGCAAGESGEVRGEGAGRGLVLLALESSQPDLPAKRGRASRAERGHTRLGYSALGPPCI